MFKSCDTIVDLVCKIPLGPSTKDVRQMGRGVVGFEISDIPGRGGGGGGGGVVCESLDIRKFLKKIEIPKLKIIIDRDSNMRAFTYDVSK